MTPKPLPALLVALLLLLTPHAAHANMGKATVDGERYGAIVPDGATAVRVDGEQLSFSLAGDLATAAVTAAYRLTNTGPTAEGADIAFVYVPGEYGDGDPGTRAAVEADGAPLHFRLVSDADLLAPRLRAWVDAHPEVKSALDAIAGGSPVTVLRAPALAAGAHCGDCSNLAAWYRTPPGDAEHRSPGAAEDGETVSVAHLVLPDGGADVARGWSVRSWERLGFLLFHVDFLPGQTRSIAVHYQHRAEVDMKAHANETFGFDYLLTPARRWAGFGPLDIAITVPGNARFTSPLPFRREGQTYRAALPGLPDGELRFQAMSLDGLWFGMSDHAGYWAILAGAMAAAAFAVGGATGRPRPDAPRWRRVLVPLLVAGPLAAVVNAAVLVLLLNAFPTRALGYGYGGVAVGALLVLLSLPAGAAASVAWAAYRARRRAGVE